MEATEQEQHEQEQQEQEQQQQQQQNDVLDYASLENRLDEFFGQLSQANLNHLVERDGFILRDLITTFMYSKVETFEQYIKLYNIRSDLERSFVALNLDLDGISSQRFENKEQALDMFAEIKLNLCEVIFDQLRINYIYKVLSEKRHKQNLIKILFDIDLNEDSIKRQFRKLSLHFHPDRSSDWLPKEILTISNELFSLILDLKDQLLRDYPNRSFNQYLDEGIRCWKTALDYKYALQKQYERLSMLNRNQLENKSDSELKENRKQHLKLSLTNYKCACRIADEGKLGPEQIRIRGYIAVVLLETGDILVAQLYSLSALRLTLSTRNMTIGLLKSALSIFNKCTKLSVQNETNQQDQAKLDLVPYEELQIDNIQNMDENSLISHELAFYECETLDKKINEHIYKNFSKLLVKCDKEIVRFKSSEEEILEAKLEAKRHRSAGATVFGFGAVTGGSLVTVGADVAGLSSVAPVLLQTSRFGLPGLIISGIVLLSAGVYIGFKSIESGKQALIEPRIREKLNKMLAEALNSYEEKKHEEFFKILSAEYEPGQRLLALDNLNNFIDYNGIIKKLLNHGFRPDGIAFLLNMIGEALAGKQSGQEKRFNATFLEAEALKAFEASLNETLAEEAKKLDVRVKELDLKRKDFYYRSSVKDFYQKRSYTSIASEHLNDYKKMPFKQRLEEIRNIARLNSVILSLKSNDLRHLETEINRVVNDVVKSLNENYQFVGKASLRVDALEDFYWVITGKRLVLETKSEVDRPTMQPPLNTDYRQVLVDLDSRLGAFTSDSEKIQIFMQKAKIYEKIARDTSTTANYLDCLSSFKQAEKNFSKVLDINSSNLEANLGYARCLSKQNRFNKMMDHLNDHPELGNQSEYWLYVSIAHTKKLNYSKARETLTHSLENANLSTDSHSNEILKHNRLLKRLEANKVETKLTDYRDTICVNNEDYVKFKSKPIKKLLSIDGGGIRGVLPTVMLCEIEKRAKRPISHMFNVVAGTSVGAMVGGGLVVPKITNEWVGGIQLDHHIHTSFSNSLPNYAAYNILELFRTRAGDIFSKEDKLLPNVISNIFWSKYSDSGKKNLFKDYYKDVKLTDCLGEFIVTAVNDSEPNKTYLFESYEAKTDSHKNDYLVDVLMATTAAPTFFESYKIKNKGTFLDGGIHLNNPTMTAYSRVKSYFPDSNDMFVLSLGTGNLIIDPSYPDAARGQLFWSTRFHNVALAAQECNTDSQMHSILGNNYKRWQLHLDEPIVLDDLSRVNDMIELGNQFIEELDDTDTNELNKLIDILTKD